MHTVLLVLGLLWYSTSMENLVKMFAVVDSQSHEVADVWVGNDEQKNQIQQSNFYFVEMTKENSPATIGMKYINNQFV